MSNEPKRPSVYDYSDLYQYSIQVNEYCDYIESEVERLKAELEKTNQDRIEWMEVHSKLQSDLTRCQSDRLSAEEVNEYIHWRHFIAETDADNSVELITAWRKSKEGEK